jgi:hypothetical protein
MKPWMSRITKYTIKRGAMRAQLCQITLKNTKNHLTWPYMYATLYQVSLFVFLY